VRDESVNPCAFVDLVEVWERCTGKELTLSISGKDGRPFRVVEQSFREIRSGKHILQSLLILNAYGGAAEAVGDAYGGNVHLELQQDLGAREFGCLVCAKGEVHASLLQPLEGGFRLGVAYLCAGVSERALAEPLLEDARLVQKMVGHDGIEHSHAAFIKDTKDGLLFFETSGLRAPNLCRAAGCALERMHMRAIVRNGSCVHPLLESVQKEFVGEVDAPEGRVGDTCLGERTIEVEQTDEARPLAAPVGDSENGTFVSSQAGKHMVAVLPNSLCHDKRSVFGDGLEHIHSITLRIEKPMPLFPIVRVRARNLSAETFHGLGQGLFHCRLRRPTDLVGVEAKVTASHQANDHVVFHREVDCLSIKRDGASSYAAASAYVHNASTS
jgi:hypothetical protein